MTEFTPAGARDGVALFEHDCARFSVAYVSEQPSAPADPFVIPGCGCQPALAQEVKTVPLVIYADGQRHITGTASVTQDKTGLRFTAHLSGGKGESGD